MTYLLFQVSSFTCIELIAGTGIAKTLNKFSSFLLTLTRDPTSAETEYKPTGRSEGSFTVIKSFAPRPSIEFPIPRLTVTVPRLTPPKYNFVIDPASTETKASPLIVTVVSPG